MPVTVGQKAQRSLTLSGDHVKTFAALTGDYNPLHFDAAFAARTKFQQLVVQGGLTTGLLHALVAMDLPGPGGHHYRRRRGHERSPDQAGDAASGAGRAANGRNRP